MGASSGESPKNNVFFAAIDANMAGNTSVIIYSQEACLLRSLPLSQLPVLFGFPNVCTCLIQSLTIMAID